MRRLLRLLAGLVLLTTMSSSAEEGFWSECSEDFPEISGQVYRARGERLRAQGYLVHSSVEASFQELSSRDILAHLHRRLENLRLMGQKDTQFQDSPALLLSFRGKAEETELQGRVLVFPEGDKTGLLMLVRHVDAEGELLRAFQQLEREGLETLSNGADS